MPLLELFFFFFHGFMRFVGKSTGSRAAALTLTFACFFFLISLVHSLPFCSATLHALAKKYAAAALYTHTHRHS